MFIVVTGSSFTLTVGTPTSQEQLENEGFKKHDAEKVE